jgi:hypothetical protein
MRDDICSLHWDLEDEKFTVRIIGLCEAEFKGKYSRYVLPPICIHN